MSRILWRILAESMSRNALLVLLPVQVYRAFETILRLLRSSAPSGETLSRVSVEEVRLEVPASSVGKIIGTRGLVIKALKEQTGAQIALCKNLKQRDGPSTVTVRGSLRVTISRTPS